LKRERPVKTEEEQRAEQDQLFKSARDAALKLEQDKNPTPAKKGPSSITRPESSTPKTIPSSIPVDPNSSSQIADKQVDIPKPKKKAVKKVDANIKKDDEDIRDYSHLYSNFYDIFVGHQVD
jgi:hypothetical protein